MEMNGAGKKENTPENRSEHIVCPVCGSGSLMAKYEAKYIYSYRIDSDAPGSLNTDEFYPFLYDKREQTESKQYVECEKCNTQYPCYFTSDNLGIHSKVLENAFSQSGAQKSMLS